MKQASNIWKHYAVGVCYYPEQWPETLWAQDLARMQKAGIGTVRVGEFAWVLLEPKEGEYAVTVPSRDGKSGTKYVIRVTGDRAEVETESDRPWSLEIHRK